MATPLLTTFTVFHIKKGHAGKALAQMGLLPPQLKKTPGLNFAKLMGCGRGKVFSFLPDFYRYTLFATWNSETEADHFFEKSELLQHYRELVAEEWTIKLLPVQAHGKWDGRQLYTDYAPALLPGQPVAVLTRASIKPLKLLPFWQSAPAATKILDEVNGLVCSIGAGEVPFTSLATFSIWKTLKDMQHYAYKRPEHQQAIKGVRQQNWYSEELFARYQVISSSGTWNGVDPLNELMRDQHSTI